jgi:NTP pyrophosphatase (non-canonical NTP hydrolase)
MIDYDENEKLHETLIITQEECAEVIQVISKIMRFGLDENDHRLESELGDLLCMVDLLMEQNIIDPYKLEIAKHAKRNKLKKWSNILEPNS